MKRQSAILGLFLIGLAYSGNWTALQSEEVVKEPAVGLPGVYYLAGDPDRKYPIWIDDKNMVTPSGELRTDLIPPPDLHFIRGYLSTPPKGGCIPAGPVFDDAALPPRDTIEQATLNSRLVILGTVTAKAYGFNGATPGQLLRVVPVETLKGHARNVDAYYVFFPVGKVKLGKVQICKEDPRFPKVPQIGDRIIAFAPDDWPWKEDEPFLQTLDESGFISIGSDEAVSLPERFQRTLPKSQALREPELLERIRAAAGSKSERAPKNATSPPGNSCTSSNVTSPTYDPAAVIQVIANGFPSLSDVSNAMAAWNSPACNPGDTGFPRFQATSASGARVITMNYVSGTNPDNQRSCGRSTGNEVDIFTQSRLPSGQIVSCGNDNIINQNIQHELGHVLGLRDSSCSGYIMSPIAYTVGNGSGPPPTPISRSIKPDECREADYLHFTPAEVPPPPPPPAQCPPDCECPPTCENGCDGNGRCIPDGGDGDCELNPLDCGPYYNGDDRQKVPLPTGLWRRLPSSAPRQVKEF